MPAQVIGVDALDPMPASFEQTKTFILKIPCLHWTLTHAKKPNFMVQLDAKLDVPLLPDLARAFGQFGVSLIRPVSSTNDLADIGGSGEGMGQRPRINQNDVVTAFPQFDRSNNAINSRANDDCLHAIVSLATTKTPRQSEAATTSSSGMENVFWCYSCV